MSHVVSLPTPSTHFSYNHHLHTWLAFSSCSTYLLSIMMAKCFPPSLPFPSSPTKVHPLEYDELLQSCELLQDWPHHSTVSTTSSSTKDWPHHSTVSTTSSSTIASTNEELTSSAVHCPRKISDDSSYSSWRQTSLWCPNLITHTNIIDDYVVFPKELGSGQYGTVRECCSRRSSGVYAVKSIQKSKVARRDKVKRELSLLSQMNHKSIIRMRDCYEDEDYVHIVTEKYSGGELFDKIIENTTDSGCFTERSAARIIKSLLEACDYLHYHGIVHRDIKPENIVLESDEPDSPTRLIDFGLARRHSPEEEGPMFNHCGTCYFMSPEIINGTGYDKSTDIWSIGIIAYILLCGYPPFNGASDEDIFESIRSKNLRFYPAQWSNKSQIAKNFICSLLRRDPECRLTAREALSHPWIQLLTRQ